MLYYTLLPSDYVQTALPNLVATTCNAHQFTTYILAINANECVGTVCVQATPFRNKYARGHRVEP